MLKLLRYAAIVIAALFLTMSFSTGGRAQGTSQVRLPPESSAELKDLLRRADDLTDELDEASCYYIWTHRTVEEAKDVLHKLWKFYLQASAANQTLIAAVIDHVGEELDDALDYYYYDCEDDVLDDRIVLYLDGGGSKAKLPSRVYLGSYYGGSDHLGLYSPTRTATGGSIAGSVKINLGTNVAPPIGLLTLDKVWTKFSFYYADLQTEDTASMLMPVAGNLLLPGPNGGASGFSLGGFPNNYVQGANYSGGLSKTGFKVSLGQTSKISKSLSYDLSLSVGYGRINFDEKFSGSVPLFNRDFTYTSDAKVDQLKLRLGVGLSKDFQLNGTTLSVGARGAFGPDFSHGSGTDRLSFTGFADSQSEPSETKTSLGYGFSLSLGLKTPLGMKLSIAGSYMHETGLPVFYRDGNNPTQLQLEGGDKWDARVRLSAPLNQALANSVLTVSDRRLKRDVRLLTRLANGIGIYRFRYLWSDQVYVGVMAQEVARIVPQAVARGPYGYFRVYYGRLGLRMQTWAEWLAAHPRQTASRP